MARIETSMIGVDEGGWPNGKFKFIHEGSSSSEWVPKVCPIAMLSHLVERPGVGLSTNLKLGYLAPLSIPILEAPCLNIAIVCEAPCPNNAIQS